MRLVHKSSGDEVKVGDRITTGPDTLEVTYFREPHKSSSSGKVNVKSINKGWTAEYYVSVIGAEWIEREDRL